MRNYSYIQKTYTPKEERFDKWLNDLESMGYEFCFIIDRYEDGSKSCLFKDYLEEYDYGDIIDS